MQCSRCNNLGHTVRTYIKNLSPIPTNIYGWNDCSDHMSNNGLEESPHNTSTWTNIYIDRSSEPTPTQASGSWLNNSQAVGITTPTELNLFGNDSAY
ncbi:hypothetical protein WN944_010987 [Citrus x changshan-huyou]|uniref:Uncharacterized protein n=1 Tax=Citrus x changshan-huyou TaxID=2935761 RepID=A0AAP0QYC7_9ROSI